MYQYLERVESIENKQMKCGYSKILYHQRNKDETIISVFVKISKSGDGGGSGDVSAHCICHI